MKELNYGSLGIHFNNAVMLSEDQFQILMDFMNETRSELKKIRECVDHKSESEIKINDTEPQVEEIEKYTVEDLLKRYKLGSNKKYKYVMYVYDPEKRKRTVQGQDKTTVLQKAVRIVNGQKPPNYYNMEIRNEKTRKRIQKMAETTVPDEFNSWKEYWKKSLEAANGRPPFKPVFDQLKKVYGLNVYEEAKMHGYKKSEVLEALFYTNENRSLFEACAKSFLIPEEKKPKVVTIDFDPDRYGQDLSTATGGRYGLSSILSTMYTQYKVDWKSAQTIEQKKERLKRDSELREKFVKSYNKLKGVM